MIDDFDSENGKQWLSNFYPCTITVHKLIYPSAEHAYQAVKTLYPDEREAVRRAGSPGQAKRMGQRVTMRPHWDQTKVSFMHILVQQKFFTHADLAELLLGTEDHFLVEGNTWNDTFWGVCDGRGRNNLGHILMQVRDALRTGEGKVHYDDWKPL